MTSSEAPPGKHNWRSLGARAALLIGLALAASLVFPKVPREQRVVFRLGGSTEVRELTASFTREGEHEAATGVRLSFPDRAPPSVRHTVSLPNGAYVVSVELVSRDPGGSTKETRYVRRVNLEGGETVLPLEDAP